MASQLVLIGKNIRRYPVKTPGKSDGITYRKKQDLALLNLGLVTTTLTERVLEAFPKMGDVGDHAVILPLPTNGRYQFIMLDSSEIIYLADFEAVREAYRLFHEKDEKFQREVLDRFLRNLNEVYETHNSGVKARNTEMNEEKEDIVPRPTPITLSEQIDQLIVIDQEKIMITTRRERPSEVPQYLKPIYANIIPERLPKIQPEDPKLVAEQIRQQTVTFPEAGTGGLFRAYSQTDKGAPKP